MEKVKDIVTGKEFEVSATNNISDGFHTFEELYDQRLVLFATVCNANLDKAWKSKLHFKDPNPIFGGGWFVVGIDTPKGQYTYHYDDKYWNMFDKVKELPESPKWDGHTAKDVGRLLSL